MASAYEIDPLDRRWLLLDVSEDEPWWATRIRGWLAMFRQMMEGVPGSEVSDSWRGILEHRLEKEPPQFLYKFYEDWCTALKAEQSRAKRKRGKS